MPDLQSELARLAGLASQLSAGLNALTSPQPPQATASEPVGSPATQLILAKPGVLLNIGSRAGQNHFELGIGRSGDKAVTTKSQSQLATYTEAPYFYTVDQEAMLGVRVNGPTTPGTKYPRTELRELDTAGKLMAFDPFKGDHYVGARTRVIHLPPAKPSVVFGQLHGADDDLVELAVQPRSDYATTGKVEVVCRINGTSAGLPKLVADYALGSELRWLLRVGAIGWQVYLTDMETPALSSAQAGRPKLGGSTGKVAYFKTGAYLQSNASLEPDPTEYGLVAMRELRHWHTGWPTPGAA